VQHSKRKYEMYVLILTFVIVPHLFYPATVPNSAKYKYMFEPVVQSPLHFLSSDESIRGTNNRFVRATNRSIGT
jgi:di/tricarboxylate transporter